MCVCRTVFKYSYFFLPSSLITNICFVVSQRETAAATVAFAFFNLLSAAVMVYIVLSSEESQWLQLCKKKRSRDEMLQDYEMKIKGDDCRIVCRLAFLSQVGTPRRG